jgi:hypothetical protein
MKLPQTDALIFAAAIAVSISTTYRARNALVLAPADSTSESVARATRPIAQGATARLADDSTDYATFVVENDLFRLGNKPSLVRYNAGSEIAGAPQPSIVRPQLTVKGIIGGPPWQAMLDGVPGVGQAIVRSGQIVGALTVRAVGRDTVMVQGMDTTWKLTMHGSRP